MSYRTDYFLSVDTLSDELVKQMAEMVHAFDGEGHLKIFLMASGLVMICDGTIRN